MCALWEDKLVSGQQMRRVCVWCQEVMDPLGSGADFRVATDKHGTDNLL